MCRLLGWATRVPTTLDELLGADDLAAFTELSTKHGDGWGAARAGRRRVAVRKRADAARTSGEFDGVIDFDALARDPARPSHIKAEYNSGDNLHPNDAAYEAMAGSIDLGMLKGNK